VAKNKEIVSSPENNFFSLRVDHQGRLFFRDSQKIWQNVVEFFSPEWIDHFIQQHEENLCRSGQEARGAQQICQELDLPPDKTLFLDHPKGFCFELFVLHPQRWTLRLSPRNRKVHPSIPDKLFLTLPPSFPFFTGGVPLLKNRQPEKGFQKDKPQSKGPLLPEQE